MRGNGPLLVVLLVAGALTLAILGHIYRLPRPRELEVHGGPILLVSIDNLRADRLGCYGYGRPTSPHLDALAEQCLVFDDASSPSNWTLPAHMSMFTSLRPRDHGVVDHRFALSPETELFTGRLAAAGYHTAAFVSHANVSRALGLARGFDEWTDAWRGHQGPPADPPARALCGDVLEHLSDRLAQAEGRKSFVFLHVFTVHWPFEPEEPFRSQLAGSYAGPVDGSGAWVSRYLAEIRTPEEQAGFDHLSDLYDAEVATVDAALGTLFDGLAERGLFDAMTIVVTADHGEAFKEHGVFTHGFSMFQEELRVPLLIKLPRSERSIHRVGHDTRPVTLLDIAPTLLDVALAEPLPEAQGDNLLNPRLPAERFQVSESSLHHLFMDFERMALRAGGIKYVFAPAVNWYGTEYGERVFDLRTDPGEQHDLLPAQPGLRDEFRRQARRLGFEFDEGIGLLFGPGLPAGVEVSLQSEAPLVHRFRARTASRVGESGLPVQSDVDVLIAEASGAGTRVDLEGLSPVHPAGVFVSSGAEPTALVVRAPGLELPLVVRGTDHATTLEPGGALSLRAAELPRLLPGSVPGAGEVLVGRVVILRYAGAPRGSPATGLSPEELQLLRDSGYVIESPP